MMLFPHRKPTPESEFKPKKQNYLGDRIEDKRLRFRSGKQRELFDFFFKKHNLTPTKISKKLEVGRKTVSDYFNEKSNIRLSTFKK